MEHLNNIIIIYFSLLYNLNSLAWLSALLQSHSHQPTFWQLATLSSTVNKRTVETVEWSLLIFSIRTDNLRSQWRGRWDIANTWPFWPVLIWIFWAIAWATTWNSVSTSSNTILVLPSLREKADDCQHEARQLSSRATLTNGLKSSPGLVENVNSTLSFPSRVNLPLVEIEPETELFLHIEGLWVLADLNFNCWAKLCRADASLLAKSQAYFNFLSSASISSEDKWLPVKRLYSSVIFSNDTSRHRQHFPPYLRVMAWMRSSSFQSAWDDYRQKSRLSIIISSKRLVTSSRT